MIKISSIDVENAMIKLVCLILNGISFELSVLEVQTDNCRQGSGILLRRF